MRSDHFISILDVDDVIAHLLIAEGFDSVEDIASTSLDELTGLQGFDQDLAEELKNRAVTFIEKEKKRIESAIRALKLSDDLISFSYLNPDQLLKLGQKGIKTRDDLAELDNFELIEMLENDKNLSEDDAGKIIMAARAHWF